jgi:hypothetical protein
MITLGTEKLMSRSEVLGNIKKSMRYLTETSLDDDDRKNAIIRTLACALNEHEEYIRGALSGRFEISA